MTTESAKRIETRIAGEFGNRAALAAAVNEVRTCLQYSEYLRGVLDAEPAGLAEEDAVADWAIRRGHLWD